MSVPVERALKFSWISVFIDDFVCQVPHCFCLDRHFYFAPVEGDPAGIIESNINMYVAVWKNDANLLEWIRQMLVPPVSIAEVSPVMR
ncbi:hypothetical protein SAMN06264855_12238 [Halorubrum vacuolatum]|uniref:Uncharacterized protein n=1 Tax=Halorubrum vacuolatum TaxID=63740 RepID=A0A238XS92_HALVU|nr:hypothetical protein SAMN06264855_12238 [Halorubrum vacuolatum]